MVKKIIAPAMVVSIFCVFLFSCDSKKNKDIPIVKRDTTITVVNAYNDVFFDSISLEKYLQKEAVPELQALQIKNFYNSRNYQYAWLSDNEIGVFVPTFLAMQEEYMSYSGDTSLRNQRLQQQLQKLEMAKSFSVKDSLVLSTELLLTEQFFNYSAKAFTGQSSINTKDLGWYIPRKKINPAQFLDSLILNKGKDVDRYEPVSRQYNQLKKFLIQYYTLQKNGSWQPIPESEQKVFKPGDTSLVIPAIKQQLFVLGDLALNDSSAVYNEQMKEAVITYQHRFGLSEDGAIGPAVLREMNKPLEERIKQILINMERIRWMPAEPTGDYLLVNIPEFRLHAYEDGTYKFNMNVVVGSTAHNTVIFSGSMKYIVFSPYWNVPNSILRNEIIPGINRNSNYLANHNMEWNNGMVRQKPGPKNSLGLVKFLFPNSYNIYLHDTPSKSLFGESRRAFSHGCIRLSQPAKLAAFLLRKDSSWTENKIDSAMHSGNEKYVTLKPEIPVVIGYFTAFVDKDGKLNFRNDVYGEDKKVQEKLFAN